MNVTHTNYTYAFAQQETGHAELMVGERLTAMEPADRDIAVGRLVNLLLEKGVVSPKEIGWALFLEEWE